MILFCSLWCEYFGQSTRYTKNWFSCKVLGLLLPMTLFSQLFRLIDSNLRRHHYRLGNQCKKWCPIGRQRSSTPEIFWLAYLTKCTNELILPSIHPKKNILIFSYGLFGCANWKLSLISDQLNHFPKNHFDSYFRKILF